MFAKPVAKVAPAEFAIRTMHLGPAVPGILRTQNPKRYWTKVQYHVAISLPYRLDRANFFVAGDCDHDRSLHYRGAACPWGWQHGGAAFCRRPREEAQQSDRQPHQRAVAIQLRRALWPG